MKLERYASFHYRHRWWIAGGVIAAFLALLPQARVFELQNDLAAWFDADDPHWAVYREFREEFGGSRSLIVAVETPDLFSRPVLLYVKDLSDKLARLPHVLRVDSLATASRVLGSEDSVEIRPYLADLERRDLTELRREILSDERLVGDLVSADGTVTAITVSFHELDSDPVRAQLLTEARSLAEEERPRGVRILYNGSMEITEEYDRQSLENLRRYPPLILAVVIASVYCFFRSASRVLLVTITTLMAVGATLSVFGLLGFKYNVLSTMVIPLITVLAIADDMHLMQAFDRAGLIARDRGIAFQECLVEQLPPMFGATLTTALGLASLATSQVAAVREFGIAAAVGVMLDFVISLAIVPLGLSLSPPRKSSALSAEPLGRFLSRLAGWLATRTPQVLVVTAVLLVWSVAGIYRLRASTNHIEFFPQDSPIRASAALIDEKLSGVYSFEIILRGEEGAFKDPDLLQQVDALCRRVGRMPHVRRTISVLDILKSANRELSGGGDASYRIPESASAVVQQLFLFALSEDGRRDLRSFMSSDFSRIRIWVKMQATASEEVFAVIRDVERQGASLIPEGAQVEVVVTGAGRLYTALDAYLVQSQIRSFSTAFLGVFGVIFVLFRSLRYGVVSIVPNLVPVVLVLGIMGWLGISLNVATVMVASIALGIIDDDTVHFVMSYRGSLGHSGMDEAIHSAIERAGGPALLAAVINSIAFGVTATCDYKPVAYWGGLMSLTMLLAFVAEVTLLPAVIRAARSWLHE